MASIVLLVTGGSTVTATTLSAPAAQPAAPQTTVSSHVNRVAAPVAQSPSESAAPASSAAPEGTPQPGGTLVMAEWQPVDNLNPFFTTAFTSFEALGPVLHGLYVVNNDGQWVPDLGTEVPSTTNGDLNIASNAPADCTQPVLNANGKDNKAGKPTGTCFTLTLKLKPGLLWSDGQPLTMNDFKDTYDWAATVGQAGVGCSGCGTTVPLLNPSLCVTKACQNDPSQAGPDDLKAQYDVSNRYIKDITVSDDGLSATVTFQKDFAGWLGWAAGAFFESAWVKTITPDKAATSMPVGPGIETVPYNGPFKIVAASTDGIDYDRNDNWKASAPANLDHLRFKYYGDKDGMITAFLNGEVDLAFDMTQADFPAIQGVDPGIGKAELDPAWQYEHLDLQTAHKNVGLDDVNVRTAIAMAINKQDMLDVLFPGQGVTPACSVAPPGTPWRDDTVQCAAYDPAGASKMLDDAGWTVNPDTGLREKDVNGDGTPEQLRLKLCTTAGNPTRLTELGKINQYLSAVGIPSDIQTADAASVVFAGWTDTTPDTQCSIYRGTYDIADYAYVLTGDVYGNYYYAYSSSQIPDVNHNGANTTRISNPDMDAALKSLGFDVDPAKQAADAATVQQTVAKQNNEIPLYYRAETTGVSNHVGGWTKYNPSSVGPTWNAETWWFIP
jgi:peptide/nickel transport system substrate-binding protein